MSREYTYSTKFTLVDPVLDITKANNWIRAQNVTRWATEASTKIKLPDELRNKIIDIDWRLG